MSIRTKTSIASFESLTDALEHKPKVYFVRFGDGEVVAMMGKDHRNYRSSAGLISELKESFTIRDPDYMIGLSVNMPLEKGMSKGVFAPFSSNQHLASFIESEGLLNSTGIYESPILFHYLSVFYPERMYQFLERFVRPKKKMFIGCTEKKYAEMLYGNIHSYIPIPPRHAYDTIDQWWPSIENKLDSVDLVITSAGAASKVISKRLWFLEKKIHLLDIGSIIDAVEGKRSRTWIRRVGHRIQKVLPLHYRDNGITTRLFHKWKDLQYAIRLLRKKRPEMK